ncbi:hypothetical protein EC968_007339 [Mortierella alpina]|nr:hypothetical protein EC968_007339 [Mortierella alpina]
MTHTQETSPLLRSGTHSSNAPYTIPTTPTTSSTTQPEKTAEQRHQETKGLIYMTLSALFFSFMSLLVSLTAKTLPSFEIVLFRGLIQTLLGIGACHYLNVSPFGKKGVRFLLFCRGLAGSCGLACFFYALSVLPLADATVIFFLGPVFTAILARIVLKEPFTPLDALASTVSMIGVVLVAKPSVLFPPQPDLGGPDDQLGPLSGLLLMLQQREKEHDHRLLGALAAVGGAMCSAVAYVIVRKIGKEGAHSMQHVTYFGVVSCVLSVVCLQTVQGGLQLAPLGPGTLMRMNDIVFAFFFQITVQHEHPDLFSFLGASLVMICTGGMALNKWRLEKNKAHREKLDRESQAQNELSSPS